MAAHAEIDVYAAARTEFWTVPLAATVTGNKELRVCSSERLRMPELQHPITESTAHCWEKRTVGKTSLWNVLLQP